MKELASSGRGGHEFLERVRWRRSEGGAEQAVRGGRPVEESVGNPFRQWPRKEEALTEFAVLISQRVALAPQLDAFGEGVQVQSPAEIEQPNARWRGPWSGR